MELESPERILAVSATDYVEHVGPHRYVGLPREEIERLYGSVELHALPPEALSGDAPYLPLVTFTVIHYNYTWLVFERAERSLGLTASIYSDEPVAPFLDSSFEREARRSLEEASIVSGAVDWRLAGLIREGQLGLVYIARLRQRWSPEENHSGLRVKRCNNGELQTDRARFDAWSQLLIANLSSL